MSSESGGSTSAGRIASLVADVDAVRLLSLVAVGVLIGHSVSLFGSGAVAVPYAGSVPGTLLAVAGFGVAAGLYRQTGCCDDCGGTDCGCSGDCGDSCSCES